MFYFSNRKLRLLIISLLLLIFSMFLGLFNAKAEQIDFPTFGFTTSGTNDIYNLQQTGFTGLGKGEIIFSLWDHSGTQGNGPSLIGIRAILADGVASECDIGNSTNWDDNITQGNVITARCKIDTSTSGLNRLQFRTLNSNEQFQFCTSILFWKENTSPDYTAWLSSINTYTAHISDQTASTNLILSNILTALSNQNTTINNIQNNTNNINTSINDSSIDSSGASSSASTWNSKNASNGTITQLLTLPITLLQAIVNGISSSCTSFSLGSLFGTNITLPCINLSSLIGSGLFTTIDILFSGFMILAIGKKLIKIFNDFTNLKSNQIDELYGGGN